MKKNYYKNSAAKQRAQTRNGFLMAAKLTLGSLAVVGMSALFVFGYDYMTQCHYFHARQLSVIGDGRLSEQTVLEQAQLTTGVNILSVNLVLVRKRLMAHPWIADAEVSRELPDRIRIRVREHQPLAVLDLGRRFLVNRHGEIFKEMNRSDPTALPLITGLEFSDIRVSGKTGSTAYASVMQVLRLGEKTGSILPNHALRRISVDREIGLTLHAFDATKVIKLGYENYPAKYERLRSAILYLNRSGQSLNYESIDLNHANRIVVTPESPEGDQEEV